MDFRAILAKEIKLLRLTSGLSQSELAGKTGLDSNYISKIERNERQPRLDTLLKICHACNSTMSGVILRVEEQLKL